MTPRLLICIPCHNRRRVAELCLPTMRDSLHDDDWLRLYDDASSEYDAHWLAQFRPWRNGECVDRSSQGVLGIQAQRRTHLKEFLERPEFTHLYFSDHDCIHDPSWRGHALRLQADYGNPLCLYDTEAHSRLPGNTIADAPHSEVIFRRHAPGVSYLLTRAHVERLRPHIATLEHFDWQIPDILGPFAVSRVGYIDHIGWGGQRHPEAEGIEGGDRVKRPTDWLIAKRAEIVAKLKEGA